MSNSLIRESLFAGGAGGVRRLSAFFAFFAFGALAAFAALGAGRRLARVTSGFVVSAACRRSGFTLLEMMVAVAVIAIAVVTLMGSQSQSVSNATFSRFNITASLLARQKLTELELGDFDALGSSEGQFAEPYANYSWRVEVEPPGDEQTGIAGSGDLLKIIDIYVVLDGDDRFSYSARSIVMRHIRPVNT